MLAPIAAECNIQYAHPLLRPLRPRHALVALLAFNPVVAAAQDPLPRPDLALAHANIVDVTTGAIQRGATLLLQGGVIRSVATGPAPAGVRVIDLAGKYVVPGLMDAHTHLDNLAAARRALETGVTTIRSASVGSFRDVALCELVRMNKE